MPEPSPTRSRLRNRVAITLLALLVAFFATTKVTLRFRWYGLYLLTSESGRPLEIKDDLKLGDGPRVLVGVSFAPVRELFARPNALLPRLELDWDAEEGGGAISGYLPDGRLLQTLFGRYIDSDGKAPKGLFVGGALPDVAAVMQQNQSGMALHDARGWHHIWCSVNEGLLVDELARMVFPSEWTFLGSRVLVEAPDRLVLRSEHALKEKGVELRMERYAYFKAGSPWFRLGVNVMNVGEKTVHVAYAYGDEPWVGEFGSSAGNVGWTPQGLVPFVAQVDPRAAPFAGIMDTKTGFANFVAWEGSAPEAVYFANRPGTPYSTEMGNPLTSNEIFIGLEWRGRTIDPGDTLSVRLTLGLADSGPGQLPRLPEGVLTGR